MKQKVGKEEIVKELRWIRILTVSAVFLFSLLLVSQSFGATKTSVATGNWNAPATWNPAGVPSSGDDVIIHGGNVITVDSIFSCNNLDLGDATNGVTTLQITSAANSLTINGALRINPNTTSATYSLDAGPGSLNIAGTFPLWGTGGTDNIKVSTGTLTFAPAITISSINQVFVISGAATINFNASYTDNYNKLLPATGCLVNFNGNYTVSTSAANWNNKGKAYFSGTGSITPNANISIYDIQMNAGAITTLSSGTGIVLITDSFTLQSGSTFNANQSFEVDGNWTNNGGTLNGGNNTIIFGYYGKFIGGTSGTDFPVLQLGKTGGNTVGYTMTTSNTCKSLVFSGYANVATLTFNTGDSLAITGDLTMNQPTTALANNLLVNGGVCTIGGDINFVGTNNTNTYQCKVTTTTGTLNLNGDVNWMNNTAVATEVITVGAGTINFANSLTMGSGSGTLTVTSTGIINFNGTDASSLNFGGATSPTLTAVTGSFLNFTNGLTTNSILTLSNSCTSTFGGNCSITINAATTLGHVIISPSVNDTIANTGGTLIIGGNLTIGTGSNFIANQSFEVDGNWTNNGNFMAAADTVTMNGTAQIIAGSSSTAFPSLRMGRASSAVTVLSTMNVNCSCVNLIFDGYTNSRTLTLGTGVTFNVSGDLTINQPTGVVTNALNVNTGTCSVTGNLNFTGTTSTTGYTGKVAVTSGIFTLGGTVNWMANTLVATEVITVSTGIINFNSSLTMGSGSGTLTATNTGTINFNGTTSPSFNFGGAVTSPIFTSYSGSKLNFFNGFTNNTNALALASGTVVTLTGAGTITPNASITFPTLNLTPGKNDTLANGGGIVIISGALTIPSGATFVTYQNFEVDGSWINNGGTLKAAPATTVTLNLNAASITGTTSTAFPILQIGNPATASNEAMTMTINTSCTGLILSSATKYRSLTLSTGTTLNINGDLIINQPNAATTNSLAINTATCLVTGNLTFNGTVNTSTWVGKVAVTTGAFTVNGTVMWMNDTLAATEVITVSTGSLTFGSSLTMGKGSGTLSVTSTGTINFNGTTAPSFNFGGAVIAPVFTTTNGCKLNFANGFTNSNTTTLTLAATSISTFTGSGAITPNTNTVFGNLQLNGSDTISAATGTVIVVSAFTLNTGAKLVANQNLECRGNWINTNGTVSCGTNSIIFNGTAQTISGTPTAFQTIQIGGPSIASTVVCTMNNNNSCTGLVFHGFSTARTFTLTTGDTLTVSGDVTINQPTAAKTNMFNIAAGVCTVSGNLVYAGTVNTTSYVGKVAVTTGSFSLGGNVTWMSNTAVATEVISVTTGTLTFANSLTMGTGTGTLNVTGAATVNFNGTIAPSFNFGGTATSPSFTTAANCTLNFAAGFTNNSVALTIANPSTAVFAGTGSITPSAAITFSSIQINSGDTVTAAGNFSLLGNWTNSGTFVPGTYLVTFSAASPNIQTITKTGGETFYKVTASTIGATIKLANDVTITSTLTMSGPNFNLNGNTLTLGNGTGAILSRARGIMYSGTFKRWFPASAITSSSGSYYGLFPIGTSTDYRPITINSTVSPTTAGYVSAIHTDATTITLVTYTDNEAATIQDISDMKSTLSTSALAGGTYTVGATFTGFANTGATSDLKLETYTGSTMGSAGTTVTTTGTVVNPVVTRSGVSAALLSNVWVLGSKDKTNTPLRVFYYSRRSGDWNDATAGNATWSNTSATGTSCDCTPSTTGYVIINNGHTVTLTANTTADYIDLNTGSTLADNGTATLTVNKDMALYGTGSMTNSSSWTVTRNLTLATTSSVASTGSITVNGKLSIPAGASYTQTSGTLNIAADADIPGTLTIANATLNFNGAGNLSGSGTILSSGTSIFNMSNSKSVAAGTKLVLGSATAPITFAITGTTTMTNNGSVKIYGDITGNAAGSTWTNAVNSSLEITGALLATGTLNASASPDTVTYSGTNAQTIKSASTSYYNLTIAGTGIKTMTSSTTVSNTTTLQDSATLDMTTFALTGNADLYMTGGCELKLQRSATGYYPEINGNYYLTGGTVTINQVTGTCTVNNGRYYNLKLTGAQAYDISGISNIDGNFLVQGSSTIINNIPLTVAKKFNYSSTGNTTLNDDLITSNFTMSAGTINDGGNTINITGSGGWNNNGGTFTASGEVDFTGSAAQQITGSQATTFNDLLMNNAAGITLNVSSGASTTIAGSLTMKTGSIYTSSTNLLRILNNATSTGGSSGSYVCGPMVKVGNDDFIFPIGKNRWRRLGISGITDSLTEVTAEYFGVPYPSLSPRVPSIAQVSGEEYWTLDRAVSTDSLKLRLFWESISQLSGWDCSNITIAHWKNSIWNNETATPVSGSSCAAGGTGSLQTTGYVSTFSPFAIGGNNGQALPVELLSFNATPESKNVETSWATALEINNDYFTVERSADGVTFTEMARVDGAGNSTAVKNYSWTDEAPLNGISYYRLKQTDYNGIYTYSPIVSVAMNVKMTPKTALKVYPNPASSQVFLNISNPSDKIELSIYDITGKRAYANVIYTSAGSPGELITLPIAGVLSPGLYFVNAVTNGEEFNEKLIVK